MKPCVKISLNLKAEFKALAQMLSHKKSENLDKCDKNSSTKNKNLNLNSTNSSQNLALYELYQTLKSSPLVRLILRAKL